MILNTRAAIYRDATAAAFAPAGLPIVHWPLMRIEADAAAWPAPGGFDALIFTSQLAVGQAPAAWHGLRVYAVGEGTAAAAAAAGFTDVVRTGVNAADMEKALAGESFQRAFYPSAETVSRDLALAFPGRVERRAVYRMIPEERLPDPLVAQLRVGRSIVPLFSRQSAAALAGLMDQAGLADAALDAVGISDAVFTVPGPWRARRVARAPDLAAMAEAVVALARTSP